jgi:hypothetical protein
MERDKIWIAALVSALALSLLGLPSIYADASLTRTVTALHPERYYNSIAGTHVGELGFFALVSRPNTTLRWWQGGMEFVYTPQSPEYDAKVEALKKGTLITLELVGFTFPYGTIRITSIELTVVFSGVARYDRYLFADGRAGIIHIKWSAGGPLTITTHVMATAIADDVEQYLQSEWALVNISENVRQAVPPRAPMTVKPNSHYTILVIPIDGEERPAPEITDHSGVPIPETYFGIGPVSWKVDVGKEIGYIIRVNPLYFHRTPAYKIVDEAKFYNLDRFYNTVAETPSIP